MLSNMPENHEKSRSGMVSGSSAKEGNESAAASRRIRRSSFFGTGPSLRRGSNPVDQDIQCALQCIAVISQRSNLLSQFRARNGGKFLNPDNPSRSVKFDDRCEAWKGDISARLAQGGHNARRLDAYQVGLKIHDELTSVQAIKIKLCHCDAASETSESREGQAFFGNLFGIGVDRGLVLHAPQAIAFDLGRLDNRRLRKARHVEAERPRRIGDIGIQSQIDFHTTHCNLPENTYV